VARETASPLVYRRQFPFNLRPRTTSVNKLLMAVLTISLLSATAPAQGFLGKDSSAWIKELSGDSAAARRSAAFALGKIGSTTAVPQLAAALQDADPAVRDAAAFALGEIAGSSAQNGRDVWDGAKEQLLKLLADNNEYVRRSAAVALGSCGAAAADAVGRLSDALGNRSNPAVVRRNAAWALGKIGKGGRAEAEVKSLRAALNANLDPLLLRDIAGALGEIGRPAAAPAADDLATVARDSRDPAVRNAVLATLVNLVDPSLAKDMGDHKVLVEVLKRGLTEGEPEMKGLVAGALANMGEHAAPALSELADLLDDAAVPAETRRNVALALASVHQTIRNLPPDKRDAVVKKLGRALVSNVEDGVAQSKLLAEMRSFSAEALARVGFPTAQPALASLLQAIRKDPDSTVRHRAVWAFLNADMKSMPGVIEAVTGCLKDPNKALSYDAARGLARALGADSPPAVIDVLERMLNDTSVKVYYQTNAEVKGGSESSGGQSNVRANIGGDGRFMAAQALAFIGPKANRPSIIKDLKALAQSPEKRCREEADKALKALKALGG
jgi:HEAT repeat protein